MGNYLSAFICRPSDIAVVGKVILRDGTIQEFSWPLTVAELMLEHPQQVVVEYHAAVNEKKPVPLPADHKLDVAKVYVMLPVKRGKPTTLSSKEVRRVLDFPCKSYARDGTKIAVAGEGKRPRKT
ncbi:uncharacterized protein LOC108479076 isoform X2 [Gossypium arboreum]|uniref:uncharacterized protein LOC108479076 isoform X2 n=1 Tax=Gossypium arboreum TaxID=29729 RepID=UPI0022F1C934|nr:uncharacterized protein LOC108479076 isoform X2 [Gossypium arboreum]